MLSVVIPITDARYDDVEEVFYAYKSGVEAASPVYEFVYVLDGKYPHIFEKLMALREKGEKIKIVKFAQWFGESQALSTGFENSSGETILCLPAYHQVGPEAIPAVIAKLEHSDMVIAKREPRTDSLLKRIQSRIFNGLLGWVMNSPFRDVGCNVRAIKRRVVDEVQIYGDLHRFLPLLAFRQGFKVVELPVKASAKSSAPVFYGPGIYVRRLLDLLSVFFMVKFTKKPLRFFGLVGTSLFAMGALFMAVLFVQRVFLHQALADRPVVLIPAILLSLGVQLFTIGLIGEIIIFTHAKDLKEYNIEEIVN